jgi:hypothetical protein
VAWEGCSMAGSSISAADHSSNTFIRMGSPHPEQLAAGAQPMAKEQEETQRREGGDRLQRALDSYHGPRVGCSWHHHRLFGRECASQPAAQAAGSGSYRARSTDRPHTAHGRWPSHFDGVSFAAC